MRHPDRGDWPISDPIAPIPPDVPVLIAGPTASGKSALALRIAERQGGVVVNADALQVYDAWPILTAQPTSADRARAPHALFGHLPYDASTSVGDWLREVAPILSGPVRPIVVGGTGLYLTALTEGLAEIPPVPPEVRAEADALRAREGDQALLAGLDPATASRIDCRNPMRVQRAWEVLRATGRGLAQWQDDTGPPLLPLSRAAPLLLDAPRDWLNARIAVRLDAMLAAGALDEARAERERWDPGLQSARAIGASALIAHLEGRSDLDAAQRSVLEATRQYAKRQRSWFRARMKAWHIVSTADTI